MTCKFCGSKVDLGPEALARHYAVPAVRTPPPAVQVMEPRPPAVVERAPAPPSPFWGRLKVVASPLLGVAAGWAAVQAVYAFLGNASPHAIPTALAMGVPVILGLIAGHKIPAAIGAAWSGILLTVKPFGRPVFMKDGDFFSLTSETHLNYFVPGILLLVTGTLIGLSIEAGSRSKGDAEKAEKKPTKPLFHALNAAGLAAGVALALPMLGGERINEVIVRYRPRFDEVRASLEAIHRKLPPAGSVTADQYRPSLNPPPFYDTKPRSKTNTAIVPPEHLLDTSAKAAYDLIISTDFMHSVAWTGPKNPMSETVMYDRSDGFDETLERALAYRYVVVYRPASGGLEVFVFDLKTTELLSSFRMKNLGGFTEARKELGVALEKATGGSFSIER